MKRTAMLVLMFMFIMIVYVNTGQATVFSPPDSGARIIFGSQSQAQGQDGEQSFRIGPGQSLSFTYPTADGGSATDTASSPVLRRTFYNQIFAGNWVHNIHDAVGATICTWGHYTEWSGNGYYVATRIANQSNNFGCSMLLWSWVGVGSFVDNTIVGPYWYAARQGHYHACAAWCFQDIYPWHEGIYAGNGWWNTYAWNA